MISNYLAHKILDHIFGNTAYSAPSTLYLGLFTTMPNSQGSGGVEVSASSYARVAVTNNTSNFGAAASRQKKNTNTITFVQAAEDWGTVLGCGWFDAPTGGNLLTFGTFASSINVLTNGKVQFGALNVVDTVTP